MRPRFTVKLTRKEMERRRLAAARDLRRGRGQRGTQAAVARRYGVNPVTAMRWAQTLKTEGIRGLRSTKARGAAPRLTKSQRQRLRTMLLEGAIAHGYSTDVWTGRRVADLLQRRLGVSYSWKYVPELLKDQLGFSWQKPERQPREADPLKVAAWLRHVWGPVKKGRSRSVGPSGSSTRAAPA